MDDFNQQLSLVVLNSEQLDGSQQVQYRFDEMGGPWAPPNRMTGSCGTGWGPCCPPTPASSSTTVASACAI
ncbi:hypothetical protein VAWG003_17560 [Aeromonas dhakensis]|nr:hypothetical protein VAWG003_17560 [Aeromonas dhakensis]